MNRRALFVLLILVLTIPHSLSALYFARWTTTMGSFTAELYNDIVPITVNNFISLANDGFYNDLIFHRVVSGFVIQDGCPYGTGYGGPGYTIQDEFSPLLNHNQSGTLAMARTSAPNSAGSQYYITLAPTPHLNGSYAVFGQVVEGLDTVLAIGQVPVNANNLPLTPVIIQNLRILDLIIGEKMPSESQVEYTPGNPIMFYVEAYAYQSTLSYQWYINDVLQDASDFIFESDFPQAGLNTVRCVIASADHSYTITWEVMAPVDVDDINAPAFTDLSISTYPNPLKGSSTIGISLKESTDAQIAIFNLKGEKIRQLHDGHLTKGSHTKQWNSQDDKGNVVAAGIYFVRVATPHQSSLRKILKTD